MSANYQHLRSFHAIATMGGVSRAARHLHVSQPTLSQQLKALEGRHDVKLFESRKAPLILTPEGRDLFALTQRLFATAADVDDLLGGSRTPADGILRLGSDNPFYAAKVVSMFREREPRTAIQVKMGNARDVMRWLGDAQIDAALASDPPGDGALSYQPLASERLMCALPKDHALARGASVPISALRDETLLLREPASKTRAFTERALGDAGIEPGVIIELQSRETIREGVALNLGVGIVLSSECPPDTRLVHRPLETLGQEYRLLSYLVCQTERKRTLFQRILQTIATEPAKELLSN